MGICYRQQRAYVEGGSTQRPSHSDTLLLSCWALRAFSWRLPGRSQPALQEQVSDRRGMPGRGCLVQVVAAAQACGSNLDKP